MNPYDFVPIDLNRPPSTEEPLEHDAFRGHSGRLFCRIKVIRPIFIPDPKDLRQYKGQRNHKTLNRFFTLESKYAIPASSLKGVIRSVAEAAANSCLSLFSGEYSYRHRNRRVYRDYSQLLPRGFKSCKTGDSLCITCRLFGMLSDKNVFMGKVSISDAFLDEAKIHKFMEPVTLVILSNPKPHYEPSYITRVGGQKYIAGRKFYFHNPKILMSAQKTHLNSTVKPLEQGEFTFVVDYFNLKTNELNLLVYSLVLEDYMYHKIGMGKPAGLGTVKITIEKLYEISNKRYENFSQRSKEVTSQDLSTFINDAMLDFISNNTDPQTNSPYPNLTKLREILRYPPVHANIQYPDQQ
ncbi:MAG TPA: RAMP superfamily CRISPR-associated protein [Thermodesulfobacteriota bacterium]|nr:RAMP superfamily CRISPR-associated protein [Thermodesulfobacteriota bacterium]